MKFKAATCEKCGAPLSFDNTQQVLFCDHCGASYLVESDKHDEQAEALQRAEQWIRMGNWQKAEENYLQITESYPNCADAWYGLIRIVTRDFSEINCALYAIDDELARYWRSLIIVDSSGSILAKTVPYAVKLRDALLDEQTQKEKGKVFDPERKLGIIPPVTIDKGIALCDEVIKVSRLD